MPLRIEDSKELNYWKYKGVQKGLKWTKEVHKGPKKFTEVQLGPIGSNWDLYCFEEVQKGSMSALKRS